MGVLNVTPDSFSDGGRYIDPQRAVQQGLAMVHEGAGLLDIGGESTRPGALTVSVDEELERVVPVIEALRQETDLPISIDVGLPEATENPAIDGFIFTRNILGTESRQKLSNFLPKLSGQEQQETDEDGVSESWVDEF